MPSAKEVRRRKRHGRGRKKIYGNADRPRLNVFRSARHLYVQVIDDTEGRTLLGASTERLSLPSGGNVKAAEALGSHLSELLTKKGIRKIVFDRGGYLYHGRIKALAETLRKKGTSF